MTTAGHAEDPVVAALEAVVAAADLNIRNEELIKRRASTLLANRRQGRSWAEIVGAEEGPLIVELLSENLDRHYQVGGQLRRAEAQALHDEGLSMERIAALFGVTRQRVSQLLKEARSASARPSADGAPPAR